jgi:hypothetical protein
MSCNSSVGFQRSGITLFGYAKNTFVGTSDVSIPGIGSEASSGTWSYTPPSSFGLRLVLGDTLGVTFNFKLKNITSGLSSSGTITSGNLTGTTSGNVTFSSGDVIAVIVSLASGAQVIPYFEWASD